MSPFRRRRSIRRRLLGMAVTAGMAWLFDPKQGSNRRAQLREQLKPTVDKVKSRAPGGRSGQGPRPGGAPVPQDDVFAGGGGGSASLNDGGGVADRSTF